jgi:hypothetical protein
MGRTIAALIAGSLLGLPASVEAQSKPLCEQFRQHISERGEPKLQLLEEVDLGDGKLAILNQDVDGDKVADEIVLFRTSSASYIPPDNSSLTLALSSSRKSFTVESPRFYLFKYHGGVYVIGTAMLSEKGPMERDIYKLDGTGISHVCSYTCGLTLPAADALEHAANQGR